MTAHIHAALMAEYAKDAAETDKPWERWECLPAGGLPFALYKHPDWDANLTYRRKPVALCQVEGRDVFPGDKLWHLGEKALMTVEDLANSRDSLHMSFYGTAYIKNLTWTEPQQTKTVYQWVILRPNESRWFVSDWLYCYWPDGTWCYRWELEQMTHMSDDFATLEMLPGKSYEEIEAEVQQSIKGVNK